VTSWSSAHVAAAGGALQEIVDDGAGEAALGARGIVAVRRRIAGDDDDRDAAGAERGLGGGRGEHLRRHLAAGGERGAHPLGPRAGLDGRPHRLGWAAPEGDAERDGEQHREGEGPEDGGRLAEEAADAREGELHERRAREGGLARRGGRALPGCTFSHGGSVR
jgi:hypothetical protein